MKIERVEIYPLVEYLVEENRALHGQLAGRQLRLADAERRRPAVKGKALGRKALGEVASIVTPDTILRWHRELVARKYHRSTRRGPGPPRTNETIVALILRMTKENSCWRYTRIRGALSNLGYEVGCSTIRRRSGEHGIEPAPGRTPPSRCRL
jgi:hypothetical protein